MGVDVAVNVVVGDGDAVGVGEDVGAAGVTPTGVGVNVGVEDVGRTEDFRSSAASYPPEQF